jgi:hypothetical protein
MRHITEVGSGVAFRAHDRNPVQDLLVATLSKTRHPMKNEMKTCPRVIALFAGVRGRLFRHLKQPRRGGRNPSCENGSGVLPRPETTRSQDDGRSLCCRALGSLGVLVWDRLARWQY